MAERPLSQRQLNKWAAEAYTPSGSLQKVRETAQRIKAQQSAQAVQMSFATESAVQSTEPQPLAPQLSMFTPENIDSVKQSPLTTRFFGELGSDWIATRAQAEVPQDGKSKETIFSAHEERLKKRRIAKHPKWTAEEYDQLRAEELAKLDSWAARRVNRHFSNAVTEEFGITNENPMYFATRQYRQAALTMSRITETLYPHIGAVSSRNESALQPISPAQVVRRVNSPNTNDTLRFEEVRRQMMAHVSGQNEVRNHTFEAGKKMAQIQQLLDRKLFAGREGDAVTVSLKGIFANETNIVRGVMSTRGYIRTPHSGEHMKVCAIPMRSIQGFEGDPDMNGVRIYTHPNNKTRESSDIKAFRKAADAAKDGKSDVITADTVRDRQRLGIMVHGNWEQANKLFDRIWQILEDPSAKEILADLDESDQPTKIDGRYVGAIIDGGISEDSNTNGTDDQSNPKFRRIQVQFEAGDPLEIQITTAWDFLRNEYEVGTFNSEKDKYEPGVAHELYDINRILKFREYVLPQKIYSSVDLRREAVKTINAKAKELINKKRAKMRSTSV